MQTYKLIRKYREDGFLKKGGEFPICRLRAEDYDAALKIAEHIEVLPGIFGDDVVEPDAPMILLLSESEEK